MIFVMYDAAPFSAAHPSCALMSAFGSNNSFITCVYSMQRRPSVLKMRADDHICVHQHVPTRRHTMHRHPFIRVLSWHVLACLGMSWPVRLTVSTLELATNLKVISREGYPVILGSFVHHTSLLHGSKVDVLHVSCYEMIFRLIDKKIWGQTLYSAMAPAALSPHF